MVCPLDLILWFTSLLWWKPLFRGDFMEEPTLSNVEICKNDPSILCPKREAWSRKPVAAAAAVHGGGKKEIPLSAALRCKDGNLSVSRMCQVWPSKFCSQVLWILCLRPLMQDQLPQATHYQSPNLSPAHPSLVISWLRGGIDCTLPPQSVFPFEFFLRDMKLAVWLCTTVCLRDLDTA